MGGGTFNYRAFANAVTARKATGTPAFARTVTSGIAKDLDMSGVNYRESRDSVEHPISTPIVVALDGTGSMGDSARVAQEKLGSLMTLLQGRRYVEGPQLAFIGVGDVVSDCTPFQMSQFESDNRADVRTNRAMYMPSP